MDIRFEQPTPADAQAMVSIQIRAFQDDARLYPGVKIGGPPGYDSVEEMVKDLATCHCHKIVREGRLSAGSL